MHLRRDLFMLAVFVLIVSCRKREVQLIDSPLLRNAITVKDGSYFVYRDSVSGEIDSFVVEGYRITKWEVDQWRGIEKAQYDMYTTDRSKRLVFTVNGQGFQNIESMSSYYRLANSNSWKFTTLTDPQGSNGLLGYIFIDCLSSYILHGKNYSDVYVYANTDTVNYAKSYYSPANGLIKLEISNNNVHKVYELLRQNIIK